MKPLAGLAVDKRAERVRPFVGKLCRVRYRGGTHSAYSSEMIGTIIGASYHATNGNSTGDLIVEARPGKVWNAGGAQYEAMSIALCHVADIEEVQP